VNWTPFSLSSALARKQNGQNLQVYISTVVMPESGIDLFIYSFWVDMLIAFNVLILLPRLQDLTDFKRDLSLLTSRLGTAQDCL
jgi:hypothetical protein